MTRGGSSSGGDGMSNRGGRQQAGRIPEKGDRWQEWRITP